MERWLEALQGEMGRQWDSQTMRSGVVEWWSDCLTL